MELKAHSRLLMSPLSPISNVTNNSSPFTRKDPSPQPYTLPSVFKKYISNRVNPIVSLKQRSVSTDPTNQRADLFKGTAYNYQRTLPVQPNILFNATDKSPVISVQQKPRKSVLETVKKILSNYSIKPERKWVADHDSKKTHNASFHYPPASNYYPDYLGYLPKRDEWKYGTSEKQSNYSMYVKLPAIVYPVNDSTSNAKKSKSFLSATADKLSLTSPYENPINKSPTAKQPKTRMIKDYAFGNKPGQLTAVKAKENQDSAIVEANFGKGGNTHFFAVADGHGQYGEKVSFFVKLAFPRHLEKLLLSLNEVDGMKEAFSKTSKDLNKSKINTRFSGSTFTCLLLRNNKIISGNVGDSRCILCSIVDGRKISRALTVDHKPSLPAELARIKASGGEVAKFKSKDGEEYGPYRVWVKGGTGPGLAMSRSFGDAVAASVGVTSEPDITETTMKTEDKMLILASDGVWDRMSNEEVMHMAFRYSEKNQPEAAVNAIINEARARWVNSGYHADDITCIVVLLNSGADQ